jgi:hypothetical protein
MESAPVDSGSKAAPKCKQTRECWKDWLEMFSHATTAIAIILAGLWACVEFWEYRYFVQSTLITVHPSHVDLSDHTVLYLDVDVQNIGNIKLTGQSCGVEVTPYYGTTPDKAIQMTKDNLSANDPAHLHLIDKGERNTFAFVVDVPRNQKLGKLTALKIKATYESQELTSGGVPLGWVREHIYTLKASTESRTEEQ